MNQDRELSQYSRMLAGFPTYLRNAWNDLGDGRAYFGDSSSSENGIRSMGNVIFTAALLAAHYEEFSQIALTREELLNRVRGGLRYLTGGHRTGSSTCADGGKWGLEWQSSWWATRMALGARLVWRELDEGEREAVSRVVEAEANRQLGRIVPSGLVVDTKAEENAWDTEILAVAISLLPAHEQSAAWRAKLIEFAINTLSVPQDRTSDAIVDGKTVKSQVYTCNLYADFALENHGAYHFCYVASPLQSIAWSLLALTLGKQRVPEALFHHVEDLWRLAKSTFLDNRFAYVGGKDWARYTYGLYFIVPALVVLQQLSGDGDARAMELARITALGEEQSENADGSFFGRRFTRGFYRGQEAKYETDCYACLGLSWLTRKLLAPTPAVTEVGQLQHNISGKHVSAEAHLCFQRTPEFFFSFAWKTLGTPYPNAQLIPIGHDDMAEWRENNLIGHIRTLSSVEAVCVRAMKETPAGISIEGICLYRNRQGRGMYEHKLAVELNADRRSLHISSRYLAISNVFVNKVTGLCLAVPNDRFNGFRRKIHSAGSTQELTFNPAERPRSARGLIGKFAHRLAMLLGRDGARRVIPGRWLNVDGTLGIVSHQDAEFTIHQPQGRNAPGRSLHFDLIYCPELILNRRAVRGEVLLETEFTIHVGNETETRMLAETISGS